MNERRTTRVRRSHKPKSVSDTERLIDSRVEAAIARHMEDIRGQAIAQMRTVLLPALGDILILLDAITVILNDMRNINSMYASRKVNKELSAYAQSLQHALSNVEVCRNVGMGFVASGIISRKELDEFSGVGRDNPTPDESMDMVEEAVYDYDDEGNVVVDDLADEVDREWRD